MDAEALRAAVEHAGLAAIGVAFVAGFVFSFNPVALASIPVSLAYVTKGRDKGQALIFGLLFILGMIVTHVFLGFVAGLGGKWAADLTGRGWGLVLGPLLIVLGLMWAGWLRLPLPSFGFKATRPTAAWGAFLLGIPFAVAVCPVCTPALVVLLGVTAGLGSVALGVVLSAFSSEVWVGALNAIQKGQREAAAALGLSKAQAFRLVVLPQLIRVALPGLGNNWMVLLKETSLVSVITLPDIMFITTRANVVTKEPFLFFGAAMLIYLVFSLISARALGRMERRANRGFAAFGGAMR